MVKTKLVEALLVEGSKLLRALDQDGFSVESMFWIHLPDVDYWRLVVASSVVGEAGDAGAYRLVNAVLRQLELFGITIADISLLDPQSPQFRSLLSMASQSSRLAAGPQWLELDEAVVYRWPGAWLSADISCDVTSSELKGFWEAERNRLGPGIPELLISLHDRRVTLRLHPQHGPEGRFQNLKSAFAIALHRPEARPNCRIEWLD